MALLAKTAKSDTLVLLALDAIERIRGGEELGEYVEKQLDFVEAWLEELQSREKKNASPNGWTHAEGE